MSETGDDLRRVVEAAAAALREIGEEASRRPMAPGKWCPREVVGHLIDSASNNHQRFVRAQFREDLVFDGYDQDEWVRVQRYAEAPWHDLVELWRGLNLHLARVIDAVPDEVAERARSEHNLDAIAWEAVPADQPATLAYFMSDYVGHLRHHLGQIGV